MISLGDHCVSPSSACVMAFGVGSRHVNVGVAMTSLTGGGVTDVERRTRGAMSIPGWVDEWMDRVP